MKNTLSKLEAIQEIVQHTIDNRQDQFDNRSETWQDSKKGEDFNCKTYELQDFIDYLDSAVESLNTFLEQQ